MRHGRASVALSLRVISALDQQLVFELALPRDIKFRRGIRDRRGVQGGQNNDQHVNEHFRSPSCVCKR
jgi:hypothetical protein